MARVSVVIPTYNCAAYIAEAVESVLGQTFADLELIVVDDGSTDGTRAVLEPYGDRITYAHQENRGESAARNRGIQMSRGEFVAFLDADDFWLPAKLERQVAAMIGYPEAVLVYSDAYVIAAGARVRTGVCHGTPGLHHVFEQLVMGNMIGTPATVLVRREFLVDRAVFDPELQWGEDWDLWLRLALAGPFVFQPEPLAGYRLREPGRRLRIEASDVFVCQSESILRKAFALVPTDRAESARREAQALRALHLRSAVKNFELGDVQRGSFNIGRAVEVDPNLLTDGDSFSRTVAHEGFRIADEAGDLAAGMAFTNLVFEHLPKVAARLCALRSRTVSEIHAAAAFSEFRQGNRSATWRHVIRALRGHPPLVWNRGLLSIGVQSLLVGKGKRQRPEARG